jgi:WD40 repeat protein
VVKFSPHNENVLASIGRPKQTLKVFHAKSQIPILENSLLLYGGLSWHFSLGMAYVAAGQDRKLSFWKILNK